MKFHKSPLSGVDISAIKRFRRDLTVTKGRTTPEDQWELFGEPMSGDYLEHVGTLSTADVDRLWRAGADIENQESENGRWTPQTAV